jgi:S1-C subfamily serine protease
VVTLGTLSGKKMLALGFEVAVVKADIRKGNSGGPLLDARTGAVLGVVFAKIDTPRVYQKTGDLVRNEGYAIPTDVALSFLRANGVGYRLLDPAKKSKPGNLVDRAKAYVARIECWK